MPTPARRKPIKFTPTQAARRLEVGERKRAQTRARLLDAAYRLFAERGSEAPTIDDVIAEAQVARGTFYNHFGTRDELFAAVADGIARAINARITTAISSVTDPALVIILSFRIFLHFAVSDPVRGWILLRALPVLGPLNEEMSTVSNLQFHRALATGRFRASSVNVAMDLGMGLLLMTIRRILTEHLDDSYVDEVTETFLVCMGLTPKEAHAIARHPIDFASLPVLER